MSEVAGRSWAIPDEWGGGVVTSGAPGTWVNTSIGLGMKGPVSGEALARLVEIHQGAGVEPRVEVCPFAHPSVLKHLEEWGFAVRGFENVFFRALDTPVPAPAVPALPGVRLTVVDPRDGPVAAEYAGVVAAGFAEPGAPGAADIALTRAIVDHPRTVCVAAFDPAGRLVGGGAVELHGEISALFGLVVAPAFRGRGLQGALIAARLRLAAERGARVATISSRPGVPTERNARRMGFQTAYTRVALARAGPGLVANTS